MRKYKILFVFLLLLTTTLAVGMFSVGLELVEKYGKSLPDYKILANYMPKSGSVMVSADGNFMSKKVDQKRTYVNIENIPKNVVNAFVSAEDGNYWSHEGVDPIAIVRAAISNVSGGVSSGASTITQQVAKNILLGGEKTMSRKIKEALLAVKIDKEIGKKRVLEIYLNEIYLGMGAYGVVEAADAYFGKSLNDLSLGEVALLAAMPKAPSALNPLKNPKKARDRRNYVLRRMAEDGYISQKVADVEMSSDVILASRDGKIDNQESVGGGWFEDYCWRIISNDMGDDYVFKRDLKIETTMVESLQSASDLALKRGIVRADQSLGWRGPVDRMGIGRDWKDIKKISLSAYPDIKMAVVRSLSSNAYLETEDGAKIILTKDGIKWTGYKSVNDIMKVNDVVLVDTANGKVNLFQIPSVEGAMIVVNPQNGDVLSMVGGFSRNLSVFNRAVQAKRQPGSSFKPIIYSSAIEMGYDATSPLVDAPIVLEQGRGLDDWRPNDAKNAGKGGLITLRRALELSRNMATVRMLWNVGLDAVEPFMRKMGFTFENVTYPIALGSGEVTPLQMAMAYSAFANGGIVPKARFISSIKDGDNFVKIYDNDMSNKVLSESTSYQITNILKGVVERGTASNAFSGFNGTLSGKTGTTNDSRDAWFVGYDKKLVVVVWIGRDDNKPLANGETGGKLAAPVVRDFFEMIDRSYLDGQMEIPNNLIKIKVDLDTGEPTSSKDGVDEYLPRDNYDLMVNSGTVVDMKEGDEVSTDEGSKAYDDKPRKKEEFVPKEYIGE